MDSLKKLIHKHPLILILFILGFISCFAIYNATPLITTVNNPSSLWMKQFLFYIISAIMIWIIYKLGNDQIYDKIDILYIIFIVLLTGLAINQFYYTHISARNIIPLAKWVNGASSWYNLPGFSFQPSEFMKIILVIKLAKVTKEHNDYYLVRNFETELQYIIKCMKIVIPPALLVYLQNDAGVVLIILIGVAFVIFGSGLRDQWFIVGLILLGIVITVGVYLFIYQPHIFAKIVSGHKLDRFYGWIDPEGTVAKEGYQLFYSLLSYGTAGWTGHGMLAKVTVFPEAQTDFIFAVILTDFGYIGGLITVGCIAALDIHILKIGLESTNDRDKYFAFGIFGMLIFQQVWNMGMILGLLPITGITLPLISYGGSSLLSYMIAMGMFIDTNSQNSIMKNKLSFRIKE